MKEVSMKIRKSSDLSLGELIDDIGTTLYCVRPLFRKRKGEHPDTELTRERIRISLENIDDFCRNNKGLIK